MKNVLTNEIQMKGIYEYYPNVITDSHGIARNLGYELGASSHSNNRFDKMLEKLVSEGILKKVYDFTESGSREGLYNFTIDETQISFFGKSHMELKLFYNY